MYQYSVPIATITEPNILPSFFFFGSLPFWVHCRQEPGRDAKAEFVLMYHPLKMGSMVCSCNYKHDHLFTFFCSSIMMLV